MPMTFDDYYAMFPRTRCDHEVTYACKFLESRGLRFGVDFGLTNAVRKAADIVINEIRYEEGWGV
jgi:hypothetical protein